ncbi:hypothetical protein ACFLZY_01335 [Patescibacteria group bacterium]
MPNKNFKLEQLFGSKTRVRLLGLFLSHPETEFFVRELTRKIDAQLNSVRRELKNLIDIGLIVEKVSSVPIKKNASLADKKKFFTVNKDFLLFEDLRTLFKKVQILFKNSLVQEINAKGSIDYLAFTGYFVDDTDTATDMIVIGDIDQKVLQKTVSQFEKEISHEINYTVMPKDEFLYRKQVGDRFLMSILEHEKVVTIDTLGV